MSSLMQALELLRNDSPESFIFFLKQGLWYLAHPYNGKHDDNFKRANEIAAELIRRGIHVYSPVSHTHPISEAGNMDGDDLSVWLPLDRKFADICTGIILCPFWSDSIGCKNEKEWFTERQKPVIFLDELMQTIQKVERKRERKGRFFIDSPSLRFA